MFILVIIGYMFLIIYEAVPLYKQKLWRDFWVNSVLIFISFTIIFLLCFGISIPSPAMPIQKAITLLTGK